LFTSPHLSDISERVQVNGVPIARDELAARMGEVAAAVADLDAEGDPTRSPTFFEVITALGFLHFDCRRVDVAVLEVGLGGRFDSTNVCEPLLSIVTNISYDHMALLGDTLPEIAFQKAGIIKRRVPVVTTADEPTALQVVEGVATESRAPLTVIGRDIAWAREPATPFEAGPLRITTALRDWSGLPLALHGDHQGANAAGVVAAVERLRDVGLTIPDQAVYDGFRDVVWPARLELMSRRPVVVLDCAHNVASAEALVRTMHATFPVAGRQHLVFASSTDKQIPEMLAVLAPHFDHFHLTRYQSNPRSADPAAVADHLRSLGRTRIHTHETPEQAWRAAWSQAGPTDGIVIAGSVFLAGELRPLLLRDCRPV
jgi:dihydrofolate synthase/folylpolyglutamate synthase